MSSKDKIVMDHLAELSYQTYVDFKNHPKFLPYLERMSTLEILCKNKYR